MFSQPLYTVCFVESGEGPIVALVQPPVSEELLFNFISLLLSTDIGIHKNATNIKASSLIMVKITSRNITVINDFKMRKKPDHRDVGEACLLLNNFKCCLRPRQ